MADNLVRTFSTLVPSAHNLAPEQVIKITLAPRAPIRAWQRTTELAHDRGALGVGVIGPALPNSQTSVTLSSKVDLLAEVGLPRDWDGNHRRFRPLDENGPTFLVRLMNQAGISISQEEQRIPLSRGAIPSITAAQLAALPASALEGRIALISGEAPWGTAELPTPFGLVPVAEVLARLITGRPLSSPSPWTLLTAFGLGGILLGRLLEPAHRRILPWSCAVGIGLVLVAWLCLLNGTAFPVDAALVATFTSALLLILTRSRSPNTTASPSTHGTQHALHQASAHAALQLTASLAVWVAVRHEQWKETARAGDAGQLPVESLDRLLDPDSEPAPEDMAISVFGFVGSEQGVLVIQPGDHLALEPSGVGTAIAALLGKTNSQTNLDRSSTDRQESLVEVLGTSWLQNGSSALYDALGVPLLMHPSMTTWLMERGIDPDANISDLASALEWDPMDIARAWSEGSASLKSGIVEGFYAQRVLPIGGNNGLCIRMPELSPSPSAEAG